MDKFIRYFLEDTTTKQVRVILSNITSRQTLTGKFVKPGHTKTMYYMDGKSSYAHIPNINYKNLGIVCVFKGNDGPIIGTDHITLYKMDDQLLVMEDRDLRGAIVMPTRSDNIYTLAMTYKVGDVTGTGDQKKTKISININGTDYPPVLINNLSNTQSILFGRNEDGLSYFHGYMGSFVVSEKYITTNELYDVANLQPQAPPKPTVAETIGQARDVFQYDISFINQIGEQIQQIEGIIKQGKDDTNKLQSLRDIDELHKIHEKVRKQIASRKDFTNYQYEQDNRVQEHSIKYLKLELEKLQGKIAKINSDVDLNREIRSISNPHFGRGFNVGRVYETKQNMKYPIDPSEDDKSIPNLTEDQCFSRCKNLRRCIGANFMLENDKTNSKCTLDMTDNASGSELVPANESGYSALRKDSSFNIFVNDGCLYNKNMVGLDGLPTSKYGVEACRLDNKDQQFNLDLQDRGSQMFYVVNPSASEKSDKQDCMTLDASGNLSIEPCNLSNYQRWKSHKKSRTC
jgi:hypothetical protein